MGKIRKAAGAKHEATLPRGLAEFIQTAIKLPLAQLPTKLRELPYHWPFPRGDLYHWIPLLDHFDSILHAFITEYDLAEGPQKRPFSKFLLLKGIPGSGGQSSDAEIVELGYHDEADCELADAIITFSRLLHENCGNRSLYASSERLAAILNTTSLSLLCSTLRLASRLAIRYHYSYQRGNNSNTHANAALRASHYNIDLEHMQSVAQTLNLGFGANMNWLTHSPSIKTSRTAPEHLEDTTGHSRNGAASCDDMLALVTEGSLKTEDPVTLAFPNVPASQDGILPSSPNDVDGPGSPTPSRQPPNSGRSARRQMTDESQPTRREGTQSRNVLTYALKAEDIKEKPVHQLMAENLPHIPSVVQFDFLNRIRATKAAIGSQRDRQMIVAIQILALTNLAYVYPENVFHQKLLQRDADQPPQLQIVQQLASLVYPPNTEEANVPLWLKTIALNGLEAFSRHKLRAMDVYSALGVNVNHGILLYILRRSASQLESDATETLEWHEWNEALVSLLDGLMAANGRTAEAVVGAGLLEILVDVLKLRNAKAEKWHHRILSILSLAVNTIRDAFQAFVDCKGLDAISDLISWEVASSMERVKDAQGFPEMFKSTVTDYRLPYFQQQTLRWLLKFVNHMMTNSNANFDRVLRNLIESAPLLNGLRTVLANANIFGSTIWSAAVNILSSFIHNEPTSYAVIAEAGLSKTLLEAVLQKPLDADGQDVNLDPYWSVTFKNNVTSGTVSKIVRSGHMNTYSIEDESQVSISRPDLAHLAQGILPATDAINAIPAAFGAICLNNSGLEMFLKSGALETFFEVFESPDHVKSLSAELNLPKMLGQHFDELVRHHPRLKTAVTQAIVLMVARVGNLCTVREQLEHGGARLFATSQGEPDASVPAQQMNDGDIVMEDSSAKPSTNDKTAADSEQPKTTVYLGIMSRFLTGFFDNQSLCGNFLHAGGLEFLLDIATSPCLPHNFSNVLDSQDLCHVFHILTEYKPHLVLPAIVAKLLDSLEVLEPLMQHRNAPAFFSQFTQANSGAESLPIDEEKSFTRILKAMVSVHLVLNILHKAFSTPPFGARGHTLFNQVNLTDYYLRLVKHLGRLYRVCVWEEIQLQTTISDELKRKTRVDGFGMGSDEADEIFGFRLQTSSEQEVPAPANTSDPTSQEESHSNSHPEDENGVAANDVLRQNVISLRYLLSQIPSSVTTFLQGLGKSLVPKRRIDAYQRQNAYMVANALGEIALDNLRYEMACESLVTKDRFAYWIVAITSMSSLLIEDPDGRSAQGSCLTLVLHAFKSHRGLEFTNELLKNFSKPLEELQTQEQLTPEQKGLSTCLAGGIKLLLKFYGDITTYKVIVEAPQSLSLHNAERDRESAYYFAPTLLLNDLRYSVLSAVQPIWESTFVDQSGSPAIRCLVEILKNTLQQDNSSSSQLPSGRTTSKALPDFKVYAINSERETSLISRNLPTDLAREALYRCMNVKDFADEYCDAHVRHVAIPRLPIPTYEINERAQNVPTIVAPRQTSEDTIPDAESSLQAESHLSSSDGPDALPSSEIPDPQDQQSGITETDVGDGMAMSIDNILNLRETPAASGMRNTPVPQDDRAVPMPHSIPIWQALDHASLEQFEKLRVSVRNSLVGKVLDILNTHDDVTFDLAELLSTATANEASADNSRGEMASILLQSLISMSADDLRPNGKKIASLANLLAILMQEKVWCDSISVDLKDNFTALLSFVRIMPDSKPDEASPWIPQTLVILEKLLSEDAQPREIKWTNPTADAQEQDSPIAEIEDSMVGSENKLELFACIVEILPRVAKDHVLALSLARVLAMLTRDREIALKLAEKRNIQRLFVMMKQLAGSVQDNFQRNFMLILRHMMEDDETIRTIIRSEIIQAFRTRTRPVDTTIYVRTMHAYVLRSPRIFLEVSNQMLRIPKYDAQHRQQILALKNDVMAQDATNTAHEQEMSHPAETTQPPELSTLADTVHPSTENADEDATKLKRTLTDSKFPTLDYTDGVVHYILSQLLAYKDIEDRENDTIVETKDGVTSQPPSMEIGNSSAAPTGSMGQEPNLLSGPERKQESSEDKPEQHPLYFYRCFLLQCLSELLLSYNRAKIEFINYSRKADLKSSSTPSKPRSVVLNYILNTLVPVNRLDKIETAAFKKSVGTSNWAMSVIVALCLKTNEHSSSDRRDGIDEDTDPDLSFIRKFVLEQAFKAFRDAQSSSDIVQIRYAKILTLADLFTRLLNGRVLPTLPGYSPESSGHTIKEVAKIMFEKGYIASLTNSIADIDLNIENARRVVKYVLRPLKTLTQTAIHLSETSDLSTSSAHTDDDEISTGTSMSEEDGTREETPDLFRHSVLGTLNPGRENESSSDSDDEEDEDMYDDYDEGDEYEEDIQHDDDEVMSDDDEALEGQRHVEGLPGDVGVAFEVVMGSDGGDETERDTDSDSESDDDDEDMEDNDDDDIETIEEITADDENDSINGHENEWEDEGGDPGVSFGFHSSSVDPLDESDTHHNIPIHMDIMEADEDEVLPPDPTSAGNLGLDVDSGRYTGLPLGLDANDDDEDDDDDDDDPEEMEEDDDEVLYPDYEEDAGYEDSPWDWDTEEESSGQRPAHAIRQFSNRAGMHHHHHHQNHDHVHIQRLDPWSILAPHHHSSDRIPPFRNHRGGQQMRAPDDNLNPLLQRSLGGGSPARRGPGSTGRMQTGLRDIFSITTGNRESPISLINNMMQAVGAMAGHAIDLSHGSFHLHVGGPGGGIFPFPREIHNLMGQRPVNEHMRPSREEPFHLPLFYPTLTGVRWSEEARLLYGSLYNEKTQRVINSLHKLLVPAAIEEDNQRKAKEAEEKARQEERLAKEKAEREEREQKEKEEREAREAAEREAAEREAAERRSRETAHQQEDDIAMEGVESTHGENSTIPADVGTEAAAGGTATEPLERVRAVFRGREVDITHLGIDLEYLNALPEELREEVLMQQLAEQRSQQADSGEQPTEIDREFLDALPPSIREEILLQEAQDRRRREREETRRQAAANGGSASARAEDMDTASFLASLDPTLRNAVLLEQDEDMLNQLPVSIAAEARALGAERGVGMHRWGEVPQSGGQDDSTRRRAEEQAETAQKKPPRRQIVQMLDKAGIATLLRILFVSPYGSSRDTLNAVLQNASENRQNRAEILSIILSVLQDGTNDTAAVEKSFTQLSVRAKQQGPPKTPQPLRRVPTGPIAIPSNTDMTPLAVIQHCLGALSHLTEHNPHAPTFFLTEHENPIGFKNKGGKKGKAKDNLESKYPINALLSLLDRKLIMDSTSCLEQLSGLLQTITQPLIILRHQKGDSGGADDDAKGKTDSQALKTEKSTTPGADTTAADATNNIRDDANEEEKPPEASSELDLKENQSTISLKRQKKYSPPYIPEQNLRSVVNIVSARDCSGKIFRDTLSTVNNLSLIPGAKEVFGRELLTQSRNLAEAIILDLDFLIRQLKSADTNKEVHGIALSKFSPSSSDQAKLLRVLMALGYIFDPSRNQPKSATETHSEHLTDAEGEGFLATLYESPRFGLLWSKLSECLREMRQRDSKTATATILLPLIEALMVVCTNTALKEGPPISTKDIQPNSPIADKSMDGLFFRFTEEHRKVLNDLVRQNPRLMSGTFSLLVKNPKVLEFDNKRNYFSRKLHSRSDVRRPQPPLQLSVRREQTFVDSYRTLYFKSADEIKYGKLSIRFHGEEGVDAGGVTREWFQVMSRQMFNPDYALFTPVASDRTTFHPNKDSYYNDDHLAYFKFIGRIIGKALYEGRALDCHFSRAVYKRILGESVSLKDMETLDLDYYRSLGWMLENDISDIITETFSVQTDVFGAKEIVDLVENGRNIPVTEENKQEYVQLVVENRLTGSVKAQLDEFLRGFNDIVPKELISIFNEQELELLISGLPDIDVDDWKTNTDYHNYSASSAQIQWFWRAVRSFDKEERAKLLQFVTGTAKVPLNGFKELEGMNGFSRFNIHRDYGNKQRLPSSHTCFNQLDLPEYDDYETLRHQLYTAMTAGSEYFGFA